MNIFMCEKLQENQHSKFDIQALRQVVARVSVISGNSSFSSLHFYDYQTFSDRVPLGGPQAYAEIASTIYRSERAERFYVGASSGTSGYPRLALGRSGIRRDSEPNPSDRDLVLRLRTAGMFRTSDRVGNLFSVGHFSILHHGVCRLLEGCGVDIIPVGNSLNHPDQAIHDIKQLAQLGVNVLVGTPSSLLQIANLLCSSAVDFRIERIVFTGEGLGDHKRNRLISAFGPQLKIFGLYGISECGFVGIGQDVDESYEVRESAFFVEVDASGGVFVTSLDEKAPVPVLRYWTGDSAIVGSNNGQFTLGQIRRRGVEFNYMGNLVNYKYLRQVVERAIGTSEFGMQLEISTADDGTDRLEVRILTSTQSTMSSPAVENALSAVPELGEGLEKRAGRIVVTFAPVESAALTLRQKEALVLDRRLGAYS